MTGDVNADASDAAAELNPVVEDGRYDEALSTLRSMVANVAEYRFDQWPAENITPASLHMHENGELSWKAPTASDGGSYDEYPSDPHRPVPLFGKPVAERNYKFMHADQRYTAHRPDVLVYEIPPLEEEVTLAGPIVADLMVSTTGNDASAQVAFTRFTYRGWDSSRVN